MKKKLSAKHLNLRLRIKSKIRNFVREILDKLRFLDKSFLVKGFKTNIRETLVTKNFDKAKDDFLKNRWAYLENPIENSFHKEIVNSWPNAIFFTPYPTDTKIQEVGFKWGSFMNQRQIDVNLKYLNSFTGLRNFYSYIKSKEFCDRVRKLMQINEEICCYYISSRVSRSGGKLDFHMDGAGKIKELQYKAINIVWHINGINGTRKGGLCLSKNKNIVSSWPEGLIHESKQLKNSCLIYDMTNNIGNYHGYPPMNSNVFRWVITSQFWPKSCLSIKSNVH